MPLTFAHRPTVPNLRTGASVRAFTDHLVSSPDPCTPVTSSHTARSLARISHYYAAKHYGLDGRRWEMQQL